jgi:protein-disulfide isomerase
MMLRTLTAAVSLLPVIALAAGCGGTGSPSAPTSTYVISSTDLADMNSEKVMGSSSATVTIIDYSSITCPHCVSFHLTTLPQLKTTYIDTGKVKLVYRDYPVAGASTQANAYAAAALARCAGAARYFDALDLLYRTMATWTAASDARAAMKQAMGPIGLASDKMDACMTSADIQNQITRVMTEGTSAYAITGTPTFIIGNQKVAGTMTFAELDALLKPLLK